MGLKLKEYSWGPVSESLNETRGIYPSSVNGFRRKASREVDDSYQTSIIVYKQVCV